MLMKVSIYQFVVWSPPWPMLSLVPSEIVVDSTIQPPCAAANSIVWRVLQQQKQNNTYYNNRSFCKHSVCLGMASKNLALPWLDLTCLGLTWRDVTWPDLTWRDLTWLDLTWLDLTWPDLTWLGVTWSDLTLLEFRIDFSWLGLTWLDLAWLDVGYWIRLSVDVPPVGFIWRD